MNFVKLALFPILAGASAVTLAASPVKELHQLELDNFVRTHPLVVVQFTTSDRRCDHCIGADATFDDAAAKNKNPKLTFARVQWPSYTQFPMSNPIVQSLKGIPAQILFKNGTVHRRTLGSPVTAQLLLAQVNDMIDAPKDDKTDDQVYMATSTSTPLTAAEERLVALDFRRGYLDRVLKNCGGRFPDQAGNYGAKIQSWQTRHNRELAEARVAIFTHTSESDKATISAIRMDELQAMKNLQVDTLQVPTNQAPQPEACQKVINAIVDLP